MKVKLFKYNIFINKFKCLLLLLKFLMKLDFVFDDDELFEEYVFLLYVLYVGMDWWDVENVKRSCWVFFINNYDSMFFKY